MSWGTCYSGSNNIHFDFPPIMSDGRNFANWQPGAVINEKIRENAGITSNWQYRKYLVENADTIIKNNQVAACDECCSIPAMNQLGDKQQQNSPYLYQSCSDNSQPFGYENSDLKNLYISGYQLQSRMVTPVITQAQLLQYGIPRSK
jgi:hypothetical protein